MSAVLRALGGALIRAADRVNAAVDRAVRRTHRPHEVGSPERVACLRCLEPWPCAALRRFEGQREDT